MRSFLKEGRTISVLRRIRFYVVRPVMVDFGCFRHAPKV